MSSATLPPADGRSYQTSITADPYHWPSMHSTMPMVYWSGPVHPGGVTSGQRLGGSFFENVSARPPLTKSTSVSVVVMGQLARSGGLSLRVTRLMSSSVGPPGHGRLDPPELLPRELPLLLPLLPLLPPLEPPEELPLDEL